MKEENSLLKVSRIRPEKNNGITYHFQLAGKATPEDSVSSHSAYKICSGGVACSIENRGLYRNSLRLCIFSSKAEKIDMSTLASKNCQPCGRKTTDLGKEANTHRNFVGFKPNQLLCLRGSGKNAHFDIFPKRKMGLNS